MNISGKVMGLVKNGDEKLIQVSHVTVRQSVFLLLLKLVIFEVVATAVIISAYLFGSSTSNIANVFGNSYGLYLILLFVVFILGKMFVVIFVIIQWLYDYYEITPKEIIHKRGWFFRKEEGNSIAHLGSIDIEQDILGRLFNYGSLNLYNWVLEKDVSLYLIHNPIKYLRILKNLIPQSDEDRHLLREHIVERERD